MRKILAASVVVSMLALVACGGESSTAPAAAAPASSAAATPAPAATTAVAASAAPAPAPAPVAAAPAPAPTPAPEPVKPVVVADGDAKVGDTTKCPVSGDEFVVKADSPKVDFNKKTYYFADAKGAKAFKGHEKKYLTPDTKTAAKPADKADAKGAKPADKTAPAAAPATK